MSKALPPYRFTLVCAAVTCAAMPGYTVRWHYGFYPTTLLETSILLTTVVFALETVRQRSSIVWRTPFTLPALLFVLAGAVSVVVAPDRRAALGIYRAYVLEPVAFFLILGTAVRTLRRAWLVLAGLALAGLIVAIANVAAVLDGLRQHQLDLAVNTPVAIYMTSNAVALFLVPLAAVGASLLLYAQDHRVRRASAVFVVVSLLSIVLSFSRGGYVALAAVAVLLAATHPRRVWLLGATALAAVAFAAVPLIRTRIAHEFNPTDPYNSIAGRLPMWRNTVRMLRDHPITGAGLSGFADTIKGYRGVEIAGSGLIYPHNLVLNFWSETGLLGLFAFLWILVQGLWVSWRGWRRAEAGWRPIHLGVLLALVAILVHGLVDVPYFKNDLSLEFWTLLGVSWAGVRGTSSPVPAHHVDHHMSGAG